MFLRKVIGSSRGRKDFGVQIQEACLHLKDHLHKLRTRSFPNGESLCHTKKKKKAHTHTYIYIYRLEYPELSSVRLCTFSKFWCDFLSLDPVSLISAKTDFYGRVPIRLQQMPVAGSCVASVYRLLLSA